MARNTRRNEGNELGRRTLSKIRRYLIWDCSSCGMKGLNSNKCKQCPQCGNSKDASDNEERSATEVDANYKHAGDDATCQFCGSENKARFSCQQCNAALKPEYEEQIKHFSSSSDPSWKHRHVQADSSGFLPGATETPWNDGSTLVVLPEPLPKPGDVGLDKKRIVQIANRFEPKGSVREVEQGASDQGQHSGQLWVLWSGILVAILVLLFVVWYVYSQLHTYISTTAKVTAVSWSYSLPLEDYAARDHTETTEDFTWRPPADAFSVKSQSVVIDHEPIYADVWVEKSCTKEIDNSYDDTDGTWVEQIDEITYDCSGEERKQVGERPVYGNYWTWKQMEWATTTPLTAKGDSYIVRFPEFVPTSTLRRAGDPETAFTLTFSYTDDDGDTETSMRTYPRSVWEGTEETKLYDGVLDGFDRLRAIKGLDPAYEQLTK